MRWFRTRVEIATNRLPSHATAYHLPDAHSVHIDRDSSTGGRCPVCSRRTAKPHLQPRVSLSMFDTYHGLISVASSNSPNESGVRPEHAHAVTLISKECRPLGTDRAHDVLLRCTEGYDGKLTVRRIAELAPFPQCILGKAVIVMKKGKGQRRVSCVACLEDHLSGPFSAASPTSHLRQQLKRALFRPEVRQKQFGVRVDHTDKCHTSKVQTFRNHLRSEKDVRSSLTKSGKNAMVRVFPSCGIQVHTKDASVWKHRDQFLLHTLRACSELRHRG